MASLAPPAGLSGQSLAYFNSFAPYLAEASAQYGVPFEIARNVVMQESSFNPFAPGGGFGQFEQGTAADLGINPNDPVENIKAVPKYLAQLFQKTGNWQDAIRAYNVGPNGDLGSVKATDYFSAVASRGPMDTQAPPPTGVASNGIGPDTPVDPLSGTPVKPVPGFSAPGPGGSIWDALGHWLKSIAATGTVGAVGLVIVVAGVVVLTIRSKPAQVVIDYAGKLATKGA